MDNTQKERIVAIVRLVVPCIASIAAIYGYTIDADLAVQTCLTAISAVSWVLAWWKDNNITSEAIGRHVEPEEVIDESDA